MPHLTKSTPTYQKHRASGQAIVTLNGKAFYLGPHGTRASHREYDRLIAEWLQNGRQTPVDADEISVTELAARYWRFAKSYYRKDGRSTKVTPGIKVALKFLRQLYGDTPASEFGPLAFRAVRQSLVDAGQSRRYVNDNADRIKRMFRWAAAVGCRFFWRAFIFVLRFDWVWNSSYDSHTGAMRRDEHQALSGNIPPRFSRILARAQQVGRIRQVLASMGGLKANSNQDHSRRFSMKIELWDVNDITPYEQNPRINDQAVDAVAESLNRFGFRQPIVVDEAGVIVCGHTRWKAAKKLGYDKVPVHVAKDLTPEQLRAYRIADNKTNQLSDWNFELLALEIRDLIGDGFDMTQLGFSRDELVSLLDPGVVEGETDPDDVPALPDKATT